MKKIIVLVSGGGTNLQAIIDACGNTISEAHVCAVLSNRADAYGLQRALDNGIDAHFVSPKGYDAREEYDDALAKIIDLYQPDLIVLAGYMRILSGRFVRQYQGRMINVHPSLLPKYTGLHTHQRAIDAGDKEHGTSVHFVTEELDGGPVILQAKVPIFADDNADDVAQRIQAQEHQIYPLVSQWFTQDRLEMKEGVAYLDGEALPISGYAS